MNSDLGNQTKAADLSFEKARYEYCASLFSEEADRKNVLERKTQFLLSIVILFVGAIFLRFEFVGELWTMLALSSLPECLRLFVIIMGFCFGISLVVSLILVCLASLQNARLNQYPDNFCNSIFSPASKYLESVDEIGLYKAVAESYAVAFENFVYVNSRKSKFISCAWYCVFSAVMLFSILIVVSVFLFFGSQGG